MHNLRQSRNTLFKDSDSGESGQSGVRISIPLHRVDSFESRTWGNFANVVTFSLTAPGGTSETSSFVDVQYTTQVSSPHETMNELKDRRYSAERHHSNITMTVIQGFEASKLRDDIQAAKERRNKTPATLDTSDQVVVDFGELAIMDVEEAKPEKGSQGGLGSRDPAEVARRKFALPEDDELWRESPF